MRIAIIPARGGSKRIPRKNIKPFFGKPMIAYSIEAAQDSGCFDKIIVSTDDSEIAKIALKFGAEVPFIRPNKISDDHATTIDVIKHAIDWCEKQSWNLDLICCIYATAPFLLGSDLVQGLDVIERNADLEYVFSATSYSFPIQRAIKLTQSGNVEMFAPENELVRSQDLEESYHDAGQFYWGKVTAFKTGKKFFQKHSSIVELPRERVQDIDTLEDWKFAEALYSVNQRTIK